MAGLDRRRFGLRPRPRGGQASALLQPGLLEATVFGGELMEVSVTGPVDTRTLNDVVQIDICAAFAGYCGGCPDGTGPFCIDGTLAFGGAMANRAAPIVPRSAADIAVDPGCP